ncbi:Small-conductance mechanosensitive channel [Serinicoccus hydrothermalis]|uniref:Small-conductance mechanosensitive channel n=1 Tax=Serinicoccus hydrothermalis TaxID=1758689 RepID=A0A1B1NAW4_9MICO|nr:mechanosensitive ion channel [Serinicoccus hydrothermalis]ANS78573.1 Small-conductance mechanosensitive channel [Serinicoccus hydrothermalis]
MNTWRDYDWVGLAEKVGIALIILIVTWVVARLVKTAFTKLVSRAKFLQRQSADGQSLGEALGQIASLLVWLLGLVAVLQVFNLDGVLQPVQGMLDTLLSYLPNLIGAGFVLFVGYIIAKIARQLTQTGLDTAGFDRGVSRMTGGQLGDASAAGGAGGGAGESVVRGGGGGMDTSSTSLSSVVGNLVFALILIVVAIASLQILGISAISDPAESMLGTILDAIPRIIAAALLLGLGVFIARFAAQLLESTLRGLGTDTSVAELGIVPEGQSASSIIGRVAQVGIILFFGVMAARVLNFPEITNFLEEVLELGGRVLFGAAIIAAGVIIAGLLRRTVGTGTSGLIIYWATIALFVAMGLSFMGIADSIINLAFGAVVVGGAAAAALAFGLGGRDAAARTLNKVEQKADDGPSTPVA